MVRDFFCKRNYGIEMGNVRIKYFPIENMIWDHLFYRGRSFGSLTQRRCKEYACKNEWDSKWASSDAEEGPSGVCWEGDISRAVLAYAQANPLKKVWPYMYAAEWN